MEERDYMELRYGVDTITLEHGGIDCNEVCDQVVS